MTILLVDDSRVIRMMLKEMLVRNLGSKTTILEAENGRVALNQLKQNPIDVIFLDWNMPIMGGEEFIDIVRASPHYRKIRIIMATTEGGKEDVVKMIKKGVNGYLLKPFKETEVLKTFLKVTAR
ncbi:MAG: response regulator [Sulfuricurvum sp.]|nr:response regulator [Sulfuricurvum sp.]